MRLDELYRTSVHRARTSDEPRRDRYRKRDLRKSVMFSQILAHPGLDPVRTSDARSAARVACGLRATDGRADGARLARGHSPMVG